MADFNTADVKALDEGKQLMTVADIAHITRFEYNEILGWITENKLRAINFGGDKWRVFKHDFIRMLTENANQ